jgi:zinc protease
MTLNRTIAPPVLPINDVVPQAPELRLLDNGIQLYSLSAGSQEVLKIELVFDVYVDPKANPLIPSFTSSLLKSGTSKLNATQIAEAVDDFGAFLETDIDKDHASITLYTLSRFLNETLPVISMVLDDATIPERELELRRARKIQQYQVNRGKVGFLANKRFHELLFEGTPYASPYDESTFAELKHEEIVAFYKRFFKNAACKVFVSGKLDKSIVDRIAIEFGSRSIIKNEPFKFSPSGDGVPQAPEFIEKPEAVQSAIRIGRRMFTRNHPDYFGVKILATVLGGYFGSRLMANIREDKGYTYGIGAGLAPLLNSGYFYVSTEVGSDVCEKALTEIYKEMQLLCDVEVSIQELDLVRNYMLGAILKNFEGPFERMERFKTVHFDGFDLTFFKQYSNAIRTITPAQLQELANKWLKPEMMTELVVGKL